MTLSSSGSRDIPSVDVSPKPLLICVCGATATGKTDLAFELASALKTEIISFDSVQVYRHLNIGSAKPPREMLEKLKHHLIDELEPEIPFTAGDFRKRALEIINEAQHKFKTFVLVGGTGFYLQALLKGMFDVPEVTQELKDELKKEVKQKGHVGLYVELQKRDPEYAKKIHSNDSYRILRGLELLRSGAKTVTQIQNEFSAQSSPFEVIHVGLKREKEKLLESIKSRTEKMLHDGLVEETRGLLEKYPERKIRALESVGYKETVAFIKGEIDEQILARDIVKNTMALAKRQNTWFKREKSMQWFDPDQLSMSEISSQILSTIR